MKTELENKNVSSADETIIKEQTSENDISKNRTATMAQKMYGGDSIIKTVFRITFPVFILMIVNSLYQMVDTIMAAQLVDYGQELNENYANVYTGTIVMQYIMPMIMLCIASTVLVNVGYGTYFSQKMGAGDVEGAKNATSTALWVTAMICGAAAIFSIVVGPFIIRWNIPSFIYNVGLGETIEKDAILSCDIYALAIFISGYQGIVSRQLRAEGHIKSMAYLPLISIPFNIFFDWLFMGAVGMHVVGASLATLISMIIATTVIMAYAGYAGKRDETLFRFSDFAGKLNYKIILPIVLIGVVPFFMQFLRIYDIQLAQQVIKNFVEDIPAVHNAVNMINPDQWVMIQNGDIAGAALRPDQIIALNIAFNEVGHWTTFFTAATRPMMLIMMPGVAVLQAGGAYLGYNYGAKNYNKVNKGILVMLLVMLIYALPSWIVLMSTSKYVLVWFGVGGDYADVSQEMINIHKIIIGLSIANCFVMAPNSFFISTKRFKAGMALQLINLILVYTVVIFVMYFIFSGTDNYAYFYTFNAIFMAISAIIASTMLGTMLLMDHKKLKKAGHVDPS